MSDDSFIREVEEELRSDQLSKFWAKFKYFIIGGAVLLVLATATSKIWKSHVKEQAGMSGDAFVSAVELSQEGKHDEAIAALETLSKDGTGQYPALAKIRLAIERTEKGETKEAIAAFDEISADKSFNESLRRVARLRSGLLLVDNGSYEEVDERLTQMSNAGHSFRHMAREGLGLSAWKHGQYDVAFTWFNSIKEEGAAPQGLQQRVDVMLKLLAGKGITKPKPE